MPERELKYKDLRWRYFFATDVYNVIEKMVDRELRYLFDGEFIVNFMDCYDIIPYIFPNGLLYDEEHYDLIKALWTEIFDTLHSSDNIKISFSPATCLELFHFLDRKAYTIYSAPSVKKEDEKDWNRYWGLLLKNQHALTLIENLIDLNTKSIPYLKKLKDLIIGKKLISPTEVFDYSISNHKLYLKHVSTMFNIKKAEEILTKQRREYINRKKSTDQDIINLGLDSFSVHVDLSNIAQTSYINSVSKDTICTLTSHGMYLILCCSKDNGTWIGPISKIPVMKSLLTLFLCKARRNFSSYKEARRYFIGTQFSFNSYLQEFYNILRENPNLEKYIQKPETFSSMTEVTVKVHDKFIDDENFILNNCTMCLPIFTEMRMKQPLIRIGLTGIKKASGALVEFAKDEKLKKKMGEELLNAARTGFQELEIISFDNVSDSYYPPPREITSTLLLKLKGYTFSDWEKK